MKITFDKKVEAEDNIFGRILKEQSYNFYVKIEATGAGTNDWLNIILDECQRVRQLNGVKSISCYHSIEHGDDACELHVYYVPMIGANGTYICPVPSQLFQAIVVSINEADRIYNKCQETMKEISSDLIELEKSIRAAR